MSATAPRRRKRVPEVIQTSAMDCGPAALASLLSGFDVATSTAHLREVCQTDVDGTSIDTLEQVARASGLDAEQVMLPIDHLLEPRASALPAIAVVALPSGNTHFLVLWRRVGPFVEVMDPSSGRQWMRLSRLQEELYLHRHRVAPDDYLEWFASEESRGVQLARLRGLGVPRARAESLLEEAIAGGTWRRCARLDGAVRMAAALRAAGALGHRAAAELAAALVSDERIVIPDCYMAAAHAPAPLQDHAVEEGEGQEEEGAGEEIEIRGVVLVRVRGRLDDRVVDEDEPDRGASAAAAARAATGEQRPLREMWRLLRDEPRALLVALALLVVAAAGALIVESLVLRGLIDAVGELGGSRLRVVAVSATLALLLALLLLDVSLKHIVAGIGRRMEVRLRVAFLERLPRLEDRYFRTRLTSDLAERAHAVHKVRVLPEQLAALARAWLEIGLLAAATAYLAPSCAALALGAGFAGIVLPLVAQPWIRDLDLRARTHHGLLGRFFLDALLGAEPIRAHGAEVAVSREHEALQCQFLAAERRFIAGVVALEAIIFAATLAPLAALVAIVLSERAVDGSALLIVYWAFLLPQRAALAAQFLAQYPAARNTVLRLTEPLASARAAAGEDPPASELPRREGEAPPGGPLIEFEGVSVSSSGNVILRDVDLHIPAGAHVAVIGRSGAGKSTLLGVLLGWLEPSEGRVLIDGDALDATRRERLRRETVWVDPAVRLWSRTLFDNLLYGADANDAARASHAVEAAELREVLEVLPAGLQTDLGEGGRLLSGGQGQRVRLGRALVRSRVRVALLDEPFRGLDRPARESLLAAARHAWRDATILFVTHDVAHALELDLAIVLEQGRVVEQGAPRELAAQPGSRFAALLAAEEQVRTRLWHDPRWRRIRVDRGAARDA